MTITTATHFPVDCEHCNTKGSIPTPWDAYRERGTCYKCSGTGIRRVRVNKYPARACCAPQAGAPDCGEPVEAGEGWMVKSVGGGWNVYHQHCPNGYSFRARRAADVAPREEPCWEQLCVCYQPSCTNPDRPEGA